MCRETPMRGPFFSALRYGSKGQRIVCLILIGTVPIAVVFAMAAAGLRLNATPSLPAGLYRISSDPRAEFVEFCPPEPYGTLSVEREYRMTSPGGCPDGGVPLLKFVVARNEDIVDVSPRGISVNGVPVPNSAPKSQDSRGRPLPHWPFGRYVVAPGTTWVASSYNSRSFDSRYFGPISETAIKHRLRAVWTE